MPNLRECLAFLWCLSAAGQQTEQKCQFEVTSVKRSVGQIYYRRQETDAGVRYSNIPMLFLIEKAYTVRTDQVKGPPWLFDEKYSVDAHLPAGMTKKQIPLCLKSLLADRFHLTAHKELTDTLVYALKTGAGGIRAPRVQDVSAEPGMQPISVSMQPGTGRLIIDGPLTLASLATYLTNNLDRPVVEMTGQSGTFHIRLDAYVDSGQDNSDEVKPMTRPDGTKAAPEASGSIFAALRALGLSLTPVHANVEHLIIDRLA